MNKKVKETIGIEKRNDKKMNKEIWEEDMDRHGSIKNAEKAIFKNFSTILPVLIVATLIYTIHMWLSVSFLNGMSALDNVIFNFAVFPILYIGITNFSVKLIDDEKADIGNIVEIVCKRPMQSYVLSFCYVAITSIGSLLPYIASGIDSNNALIGIGFIINSFLTVKFVLAIYIFVKGYEKTAIGALERAWNESKGFGLELMKIYLTVIMMTLVLTMSAGLITFLVAGVFGFVGVDLGEGLVSAVGSMGIGIMGIFENLAFAYLATDIFSGSIESERFFDGVDKKSMQNLLVKVCILVGVVALGWVLISSR